MVPFPRPSVTPNSDFKVTDGLDGLDVLYARCQSFKTFIM